MIAPVSTWQAQFYALPPVPTDGAACQQRALAVTALLAGIQIGLPFSGTALFTFATGVFASGMEGVPISPSPIAMAIQYSLAFQAACTASVWLVTGGYLGVPTPPTTFSAPPVAVFAPTSVAAATAQLQSALAVLKAPTVIGPQELEMPKAFQAAFASLQVMLTGLNSVPPTPQPLIATVPVL